MDVAYFAISRAEESTTHAKQTITPEDKKTNKKTLRMPSILPDTCLQLSCVARNQTATCSASNYSVIVPAAPALPTVEPT